MMTTSLVLASARPFLEGSTGEVAADVMMFVALFLMFVVVPFVGWLDGRAWDRHDAERERQREAWSWLSEDDLKWFAENGAGESVKREQDDRSHRSRNYLSPHDWME